MSLRAFNSGGSSMTTASTFGNAATNFTFASFSGQRYAYYCRTSTGSIYLRNLSAGTEISLPGGNSWPITSVKCAGRNMIFDYSTNTLTFIFQQNGLYGVGQLLNADPASNGI